MRNKFLKIAGVAVLGAILLCGCSDSYLVDNGVNLSEGKPCGIVRMVDLSSPLTKALPMTKTYADKVYRTLSSFSSFDGKSVTALDLKRTGKEAFTACCLLEYDWEGNLIRNFELSVSLTSLACDGADGALYGISETDGVTLVKLEL